VSAGLGSMPGSVAAPARTRQTGLWVDTPPCMPTDNVEVIRALYDAWNRDEFPGPIDLLDPDIEYVNPEGAVEPGIRRGIDEFSSAIARVLEGWVSWRMEPERFEASGNRVAVVVRYAARGRSSGVEVEGHESALWTLRNGRVVRYAWFHDPQDALRAVGLS
jgi:ketosteroid isomerase-like protein